MSLSATDQTVPLRHQLALEDWYMSQPTYEWLQNTLPEQAAGILAEIAQDAQPEPHSYASQLLAGLAAIFASSDNLMSRAVARRVGTRAALMLADLGDPRALPPLVRVFETSPIWQGKYQELVEASLTRLLSKAMERPKLRDYESDIQTLVERAWKAGRGELSGALADLLIAALRCLHALGGAGNLAIIRSLADAQVTQPNRLRVKEAARNLKDA